MYLKCKFDVFIKLKSPFYIYFFFFSDATLKNATVVFTYQTGNEILLVESNHYIAPIPNITIVANETKAVTINITSTGVGHLNLGINSSSNQFKE